MQYQYIAIEGNIGAGKTTLATRLANHYNARLILEEFAENTFLPKFYKEPDLYAFPLELSFLAARFTQLKEILSTPDLFSEMVIADYTYIKSKLFARVNLKADEWELFQKLSDIIGPQLRQPDVLIFLQAPVPILQDHIRHRARSYEQAIPDDYLESLGNVYEEYLRSMPCPIIWVDAVSTDFLNNDEDFQRLTGLLDNGIDRSVDYFQPDRLG